MAGFLPVRSQNNQHSQGGRKRLGPKAGHSLSSSASDLQGQQSCPAQPASNTNLQNLSVQQKLKLVEQLVREVRKKSRTPSGVSSTRSEKRELDSRLIHIESLIESESGSAGYLTRSVSKDKARKIRFYDGSFGTFFACSQLSASISTDEPLKS